MLWLGVLRKYWYFSIQWNLEYQKLLEVRASKIQKLENNLREISFGSLQKTWNSSHVETGQIHGSGATVHTASGQSLFEINIQKVSLQENILTTMGIAEPKVFLSWLFYDSDQSYTPVLQGPTAVFNSSSYYKIQLDDSFLEFLMDIDDRKSPHFPSCCGMRWRTMQYLCKWWLLMILRQWVDC